MQTKPETTEPLKTLSTIVDFLDGVKTVAIAAHEHPDADAIGSSLAAYLYLRANAPEVDVDVYLEADIDEALKVLPGMDEVKHELVEGKEYDLFILMDISSKERVGVAGPALAKAKKTICFDHHVTNKDEYDWLFNYPDSSSTCEVFCNYLDAQKVTPPISENLFTGVVHDTGVFRYASTSPKTHQLAANLMRRGINAAKIIQETFFDKTQVQQRMLGKALLKAEYPAGGRVCTCYISDEELRSEGASTVDLEGVVAALRDTKGVEIAVFLYDTEPGVLKGSLRSRKADVSALAAVLGGGGHVRASGFRFEGTAEEAVAKILPLAEKAIADMDAREAEEAARREAMDALWSGRGDSEEGDLQDAAGTQNGE